MGKKNVAILGQWTTLELSNHGLELGANDTFKIQLEVFITTTPKISKDIDGIIGLVPCGIKESKNDTEFKLWAPKSVHFQLGQFLKVN